MCRRPVLNEICSFSNAELILYLRDMETLNPLQLEILKLFRNYENESELLDLKQALIEYLSNGVVTEADKAFIEKGYDNSTIEQWRKEHNRKK